MSEDREQRGQKTENRGQRGVVFCLLSSVFCLLSFSGCGDTYLPNGREALNKPFGTGPEFTLGTTKAEVLDWWGPPDLVVPRGVDEIGSPKEEWIYHGRAQGLPIDVEYVSRDKHLFFEGNSLVKSEMHDPRRGGTGPTSYTEAAP